MTVRVIARWATTPETTAEVRTILIDLAQRSRAEPGCDRFEIWQAAGALNQYILIEDYRDADARAAHLASAHFNELVLRRGVPLLAERDVRVHEQLDV